MSKIELRKQVIARRNTLSQKQLMERSAKIVTTFLNLPEYHRAATVMAYVDFRNEVQTTHILENILQQGKRLVLPVTDVPQKKLIPSLILHFPDDLTPGTWGILEPSPQRIQPVEPKEIDLVIVPGVAFDTRGNRLGYGGGFYDRFLPNTRKNTTLVALAYELQVSSDVYHAEQDVPIHILITEERLLYFS